MKKYVKASDYLKLTEADVTELTNRYLKLFEDQGFEMEVHDGYGHIVLSVVAVNGDYSMVYDGQPCAGGYAIFINYFFSPELRYMTETRMSDKALTTDVAKYVDKWLYLYDALVTITDQIHEIEPKLSSIVSKFETKYMNQFPDLELNAEIYVWSTGNIDGKYKYPLLYNDIENNPAILFTGIAAGEKFSEKYTWKDWISGQGEAKLVKTLSRIYKSKQRKSTSKNNEIIAILQEHDIDTTKSKYELVAETYERYSSGRRYKKSFTCPGDYLAYFSMCIHSTPNYQNLINYFGDVYEFEEFVDDNPTLEDIADVASSSWWGDGDDYIISLINTSTGNVLYASSEDEDYESSEEEWED